MSARTEERPGLRQSRRARSTGTTVELIDLLVEPVSDPEDGGRWMTLCVEHGGNVQHDNLTNARAFASAPEEWCPDCQETRA